MAALIDEYKRSWDPAVQAWMSRKDATNFALFLAGELRINNKGVEVDKDGKYFRVYVPLFSVYWAPGEDWSEHLNFLKEYTPWASN